MKRYLAFSLNLLAISAIAALFLVNQPSSSIVQAANTDWKLTNVAGSTDGNDRITMSDANNSLIATTNQNSQAGTFPGGPAYEWQFNGSTWTESRSTASDQGPWAGWSYTRTDIQYLNGSYYMLISGSCHYADGSRKTPCQALGKSSDGKSWTYGFVGTGQDSQSAGLWVDGDGYPFFNNLVVFRGSLYFAAVRASNGIGTIYKDSNGTITALYNGPYISGLTVFKDQLYGFSRSADNKQLTVVRSSDGSAWSEVQTIKNLDGNYYGLTAVFGGKLYTISNNTLLTSDDGTSWSRVALGNGYSDLKFGNSNNIRPSQLAVSGAKLYAGTYNNAQGAELWSSTDGSSWSNEFKTGVGIKGNTRVDAISTYKGAVYVGLRNYSGDQIYTRASTTSSATLAIALPPSTLFTPKTLLLGNQTYNFAGGSFAPPTQGKISVSTGIGSVSGYPSYNISVSGYEKGNKIAANSTSKKVNAVLATVIQKANAQTPPPADTIFWLLSNGGQGIDYRMTFQNPPLAEATKIANELIATPSKISGDLYLNTNADCSNGDHTKGTYLCARTAVSFATPELPTVTKYLLQSINALPAGIVINGNVAAPKNIANFTFGDPKSVAVGGNVSVTGGQNLNGYQTATSQLTWANIKPQLQTIYNERTKGTLSTISGYVRSVWNLNSNSNSPADANVSSFSSSPEGKLWNVDNDITFTVPAGGLAFNGRGTIVVNGNVVFKGNGPISCSNGEFGIIASGSITFQNGVGPINCGAYVAMNGNINLNQQISATQSWNTIFVASNNVVLPTVSAGTLIINYDAAFANNPTILFTDILAIVFASS